MIERYLTAHKKYYSKALSELKNGKKQTHWMWFIFPQIKGLGESETDAFYSIKSLKEAKEYINNEYLHSHMEELLNVLLNLKTNDPMEVFGYIDSLKLCSSITLFQEVDNNPLYQEILNKYYDGQNDSLTKSIIEFQHKTSSKSYRYKL